MKKSIAMKWIKALESGEYKQTKGQLRKSGAFCCLGVLCNLHAQEHPELAKTQKKATVYFGNTELPPEVVVEWAEMSDENPDVDHPNYHWGTNLARLNDDGYTFKEIAAIIRAQYKDL